MKVYTLNLFIIIPVDLSAFRIEENYMFESNFRAKNIFVSDFRAALLSSAHR